MSLHTRRGWRPGAASVTSAPALSAARQWALGGALTVVLVGLAARLAYWQIGQQRALAAAADAQHQHAILIPSGRGMILDRHGNILALTVSADAIVADPFVAQDADQAQRGALSHLAEHLATLTGAPAAALATQLRLPTGYHILTGVDGAPLHLSPDGSDQAQTMIAAGLLPGCALLPQSWRVAPAGPLAAQVLGFVQAGSGAGQYGVEAGWNADLAGVPGRLITAVDAAGNPILAGAAPQTPAQPGADVTLTLDANLQAIAEQGLSAAVATTGAAGGSVIIVDPQTGAILALANAPGFDPNDYAAAPLANFLDPAVASIYDPGSTMKAVTMAAGIDTGVITPTTTINDLGTFTVDGQTIFNWQQIAWGPETMTQVLEHSANVGAAWVAVDRLGAATFDRYLAGFGFGAATGVGLPGEVPGLLAPPEPTAGLTNLDLAENAFGESIGVTPLQMTMAYAALANGGVLMRPMIVQAVTRAGQTQTVAPVAVRRVVSAQTAATVTQMLVASALHSDAQTSLIPGFDVAAKTGTSTPDPLDPSVTYASVLGYAPASQPRFVVLVKLDHPTGPIMGGDAAGPLWRSLVRQLLAYDHISPQGGH